MFRHYATYGWPKKLLKIFEKIRNFFSIFPQTGTVEEKTWHFEVLLLFLSLRYGADLGRSRLVCCWFVVFKDFQALEAQPLRRLSLHLEQHHWTEAFFESIGGSFTWSSYMIYVTTIHIRYNLSNSFPFPQLPYN